MGLKPDSPFFLLFLFKQLILYKLISYNQLYHLHWESRTEKNVSDDVTDMRQFCHSISLGFLSPLFSDCFRDSRLKITLAESNRDSEIETGQNKKRNYLCTSPSVVTAKQWLSPQAICFILMPCNAFIGRGVNKSLELP